MYLKAQTVTVTTDADGDATAYTADPVSGRVLSIGYTKHGSASYTDGVDFTITGESTGQALWVDTNVNATETVSPRQAIHSTAGAAALFAAGGTALLDYVFLVNERIKIVVAAGGDTKIGTFLIVTDGGRL
jgi:hypothetical protein